MGDRVIIFMFIPRQKTTIAEKRSINMSVYLINSLSERRLLLMVLIRKTTAL